MGHLLLVDNDTDILELLEMGLTAQGFEVRTATSGVEALRSIEESVPDVLITDLIMPNIGGEKLLKIVHSVPEWRDIRTIVVSGVAAEAPDIRERTPCDIYIAKGPIASTMQYLLDSLRNFERVAEMSRRETIGTEGIFSRHITRELLEFKQDVDQILDHISDGLCKVDRSLTIVWMNRAFARLVGQPEEDLLGRPMAVAIGEQGASLVQELATNAGHAPRRAAELTISGNRLARTSLLYDFDEDDGYAALMWQDVTERLLLEEQYENIVESSNDVIWTTDLSGSFTYVSSSSGRILVTDPADIAGRPFWSIVHPDDRERVRDCVQSLLQRVTSENLSDLDVEEWRLMNDDDQERWAQCRTSALRDRGGRSIGLQGTISDITEQRRLTAEREALLHEVHHRVRDNLQLLGSLAQLSGPDMLESRIAALGEVFDELYRERSFSAINPRPLLNRVVSAAQANNRCPITEADLHELAVASIPMRRAVPLALLVNELIQEICAGDAGTEGLKIHVALLNNAETGHRFELHVDAGDRDSLASQESQSLPESGIPALMVNQLGGAAQMWKSATARRYVVRFS